MSLIEALNTIFSHNFGSEPKTDNEKIKSLTEVSTYVAQLLDNASPIEQHPPNDARQGRLGADSSIWDINTSDGLFIIGTERLSLNAQANFSTIMSNTCVYAGKWQYEVQLGSKGVMQLGWATKNCHFTQESGVGDTANSYAYDGNRCRKWNGSTEKYGEPWLSGDVIGCCADFNIGVITFYRNGHSLGEAFNDVTVGPKKAYFPAVSLGFGEHIVANFGSIPFRYPIDGYQPLQRPPTSLVNRCNMVLTWFKNYIDVYEAYQKNKGAVDETKLSMEAYLTCVSRILFFSIAPLLTNPYVCESCLIPLVEQLTNLSSSSSIDTNIDFGNKLNIFLDILWSFYDRLEMQSLMEHLCQTLLSQFRHTPGDLAYREQKYNLNLLRAFCHHTRTRKLLIDQIFFDSAKLAEFLHVKMLDEPGLVKLVTKPWWPSGANSDIEDRKKSYLDSVSRISAAVRSVEAIQVELLKVLMINTDGTETNPSSRKIFLRRLRIFFHDTYISTRSIPLVQIPLPVTLCCFHRFITMFQHLWVTETGKQPLNIPSKEFYEGNISYYTIDRVGGVFTHLTKTFQDDLARVLGPNHDVITGKLIDVNPSAGRIVSSVDVWPSIAIRMPQEAQGNAGALIPNLVPVLTRLIQQANFGGPSTSFSLDMTPTAGLLMPDNSLVSGGRLQNMRSLLELFDGLVLFYHTSAYRQMVKVSVMRDSMEDYITAYEKTRALALSFRNPTKSMKRESSVIILSEVQNSCNVFQNKLCEQARFMAWVRAAIFAPQKRDDLVWLLTHVLQACKTSADDGALFAFLPEFYLDTLFELVLTLRHHIHPTCPLESIPGYQKLLGDVSEYLCQCFTDTRIVNAASKDTVVQALANFVADPITLKALEQVPVKAQMLMVRSLLKPYENRAWAQSNWVLMRFWQGQGFAFRYEKSPHLGKKNGPKFINSESSIMNQSIKPLPSIIYQNHVKDILLNDEPVATSFINSILNQLNWSFSEFIGMLQEIQNISIRPERVYIESRQLRICSTCFDLSLGLLRVLEMVATLVPEIFNDKNRPNSELMFTRLCSLICQVLNRVSSKTGCFHHVVMLEIPDLEIVHHFPILAAVMGILVAVFKPWFINFKENSPVPPLARSLISDPSFQFKSLTFVMGDFYQKVEKGSVSGAAPLNKAKVFSLSNYEGDVTDKELNEVRQLIQMFEFCQRKVSAISLDSDDDVCTICYASPVSVVFKPCNHQSCKSCIGHHLLNGRECFFCKAIIEKVVDLQGNMVHDLGSAP